MMDFKTQRSIAETQPGKSAVAGWAGWLYRRLRSNADAGSRTRPSLALVQRITLAPRQSLALIEADGHRLLVATSQDGAPAFYPLDEVRGAARSERVSPARVSW